MKIEERGQVGILYDKNKGIARRLIGTLEFARYRVSVIDVVGIGAKYLWLKEREVKVLSRI